MSVKKCCKCGVVKALTEFSKDRSRKGGFSGRCKCCDAKKHKLYRETHREELAESQRRWAKDNRDKKNTINANRRAAKLQRTVAWGNKDLIDDVYARAQRLTEATGIPMEVDHIYPLQGAMVSGLHVENNLQILPKAVNASKSNKFKVQ